MSRRHVGSSLAVSFCSISHIITLASEIVPRLPEGWYCLSSVSDEPTEGHIGRGLRISRWIFNMWPACTGFITFFCHIKTKKKEKNTNPNKRFCVVCWYSAAFDSVRLAYFLFLFWFSEAFQFWKVWAHMCLRKLKDPYYYYYWTFLDYKMHFTNVFQPLSLYIPSVSYPGFCCMLHSSRRLC